MADPLPNLKDLCGWGPQDVSKKEHELFVCGERDAVAAAFATPFFMAGQEVSGAGKSVRLWKIYQQITGKVFPTNPPQPTGDCVARGLRGAILTLQCSEIAAGDSETCKDIAAPYIYAVSRVLIGKNRLKGKAGSVGSWAMQGGAEYGFISPEEHKLPGYTKANVDDWGNDKKVDGLSFRDLLESGDDRLIKSWSPITAWEQVRDALFHRFAVTIAGMRGYTMKAGADGFHRPSGSWPHQMFIAGYGEAGRKPWVAIANSWGDVHGRVKDPETGEPWPPGFLCVTIDDFVKYHLKTTSTECLVASNFDGFPARVNWEDFA